MVDGLGMVEQITSYYMISVKNNNICVNSIAFHHL